MMEKCKGCSSWENCSKVQQKFELSDRDMEILDILGREIIPAACMSTEEPSIDIAWKMSKKWTEEPTERLKIAYFLMGIEFVFQSGLAGKTPLKPDVLEKLYA